MNIFYYILFAATIRFTTTLLCFFRLKRNRTTCTPNPYSLRFIQEGHDIFLFYNK